MEFKPAKSRALVVRKGKVTDKFCFSVGGIPIPSVTEKPVKSLGKMLNSTLKDSAALQATSSELGTLLTVVDKFGLPGKFKAWIYQRGIMSRLFWPLLAYEVPLTIVEGFEISIRAASKPQQPSILWLQEQAATSFVDRSLTEEFMLTWAREVLLYTHSSDTKMSSAGIKVRTGRKWKVCEAVKSKAQRKERHKLVQDKVRAGMEEGCSCRSVGMWQQGVWTGWIQVLDRKITWTELWKAEPHCIRFLI